ncbi:coiled-coil domain-containing protein 15 isoform X2 [Erpetoichthys calabaricus]|uniref:coiled-coil domain-containing protein 15 isoform X2 n=1 Tax=Erpetoichthys calabaricus TaxID=27687 RepID=UPI00109FBDE1|nr:coiled-coil domain-containing protein 15 isoform X2 [Erpetoichthys calabaricus]
MEWSNKKKMAESEGRVVQQLCNASQRLSPQKTAQRHHMQSELAICGPSARFVSTRSLIGSDNEADRTTDSDHTKQLSKVLKQARHRLASCQTLPMENSASELPGGVWRVSPTRDKSPGPLLPPTGGGGDDEDDDDVEDYTEEMPLASQHDLPLYMQGLIGSPKQTGRTVNFQDVLVCDRSQQEPLPAGPSLMESISTLPPWADVNQEDIRKQRQAQFLMYRRLFMDIEREQVKEQRRHRDHLQRISSIKQEKERQRRDEERRMQQPKHFEEEYEDPGKTEREVLARLQMEEREARERKEKQKKAQKRESFRFIEALRAMMKEKIEHHNFDLPPLCCCGESFWDSHPDTCANNCVFYKNPKAYAKALQAVLSSCDLWEGGLGHRTCVQKIASASARSPKK